MPTAPRSKTCHDLDAALSGARDACQALGADDSLRPAMQAFLDAVAPQLQRQRTQRDIKPPKLPHRGRFLTKLREKLGNDDRLVRAHDDAFKAMDNLLVLGWPPMTGAERKRKLAGGAAAGNSSAAVDIEHLVQVGAALERATRACDKLSSGDACKQWIGSALFEIRDALEEEGKLVKWQDWWLDSERRKRFLRVEESLRRRRERALEAWDDLLALGWPTSDKRFRAAQPRADLVLDTDDVDKWRRQLTEQPEAIYPAAWPRYKRSWLDDIPYLYEREPRQPLVLMKLDAFSSHDELGFEPNCIHGDWELKRRLPGWTPLELAGRFEVEYHPERELVELDRRPSVPSLLLQDCGMDDSAASVLLPWAGPHRSPYLFRFTRADANFRPLPWSTEGLKKRRKVKGCHAIARLALIPTPHSMDWIQSVDTKPSSIPYMEGVRQFEAERFAWTGPLKQRPQPFHGVRLKLRVVSSTVR